MQIFGIEIWFEMGIFQLKLSVKFKYSFNCLPVMSDLIVNSDWPQMLSEQNLITADSGSKWSSDCQQMEDVKELGFVLKFSNTYSYKLVISKYCNIIEINLFLDPHSEHPTQNLHRMQWMIPHEMKSLLSPKPIQDCL